MGNTDGKWEKIMFDLVLTEEEIRLKEEGKPRPHKGWELHYLDIGLPARSRFGEGRDLVIGI